MSIEFAGARRIIVLLCCAWGVCNGCHAQAPNTDTGTDPSMVIEQCLQSYVVNPDGSYTLTVDETRTIVQQRAVAEHGRQHIVYQSGLDRIGAIAAYTQKPDGRRLVVKQEQISDRKAAQASREEPMLRDARVRVVLFPEVAVGDKLVLHYVLARARALLPGHFDDLSSSGFYLNRQFILSYDMPAGMPLHADAVGFRELAVTGAPGRKRYRWQYVPGQNSRIEAESVSYLDYGKRLAVSTFADYGAFAQAFRAGARIDDKTAASPVIEALAMQLVAGLPDRRNKALALANWVRKNIGHDAAYIHPGGAARPSSSEVLARRHGDSQDHACLLAALLLAAGIDSSAALVNGENAYGLPRAPTLGILNHMIIYVPGLDLFLDATSKSTAPGYLQQQLLGKPALLIASGKRANTPAFQLQQSRNRIEFQVARSGASRFRVIKTATGAIAEPYRQALREAKPAERDSLVARMLNRIGLTGDGIVDAGRLDGDSDHYQMVFAGISEHFANLPGPTGIATSFNFWGGLLESASALAQATQRSQDFICHGFDSIDETAFEFAPGVQILALPKALALHGPALSYRADYAIEGNTVTVRRHARFSPAGAVCTAKDYRRMQTLLEPILRDLHSQIVVQGL
jgi:hypothetical protein